MDRNTTRRNFLKGLIGAVGGGALTGTVAYQILDGSLRGGVFDTSETTSRDFRVIGNFEAGDSNLTEILGLVPIRSRESYLRDSSEKVEVYKGALDYLEALQRGSLEIPTVESKPVKGVRDLKSGILKWTKGLLGKNIKKEAEIQSKKEHTPNYNDLAKLRMSTMERISKTEKELDELAHKVGVNIRNSGKDYQGLSLVENLMGVRGSYMDLLRGFRDLEPEQILQGNADDRYRELFDLAKSHGIKPYTPKGILSNVVTPVSVAIGIVGAIMGRRIAVRTNRPTIKKV